MRSNISKYPLVTFATLLSLLIFLSVGELQPAKAECGGCRGTEYCDGSCDWVGGVNWVCNGTCRPIPACGASNETGCTCGSHTLACPSGWGTYTRCNHCTTPDPTDPPGTPTPTRTPTRSPTPTSPPPSIPLGISSSCVTVDGYILFDWDPSTPTPSSYDIAYRMDSDTWNYEFYSESRPGITQYMFDGTANLGHTHRFMVRACAGSNCSGWSAGTSATCPVATNTPTRTPTPTQTPTPTLTSVTNVAGMCSAFGGPISLSWQYGSPNGEYFNIKRAHTSDGWTDYRESLATTQINPVPTVSFFDIHSTIPDNQIFVGPYDYYVKACYGSSCGAYSTPVASVNCPTPPPLTNFDASCIYPFGPINLTWSNSNPLPAIAETIRHIAKHNGTSWNYRYEGVSGDTFSFTDPVQATPGQTYGYNIRRCYGEYGTGTGECRYNGAYANQDNVTCNIRARCDNMSLGLPAGCWLDGGITRCVRGSTVSGTASGYNGSLSTPPFDTTANWNKSSVVRVLMPTPSRVADNEASNTVSYTIPTGSTIPLGTEIEYNTNIRWTGSTVYDPATNSQVNPICVRGDVWGPSAPVVGAECDNSCTAKLTVSCDASVWSNWTSCSVNANTSYTYCTRTRTNECATTQTEECTGLFPDPGRTFCVGPTYTPTVTHTPTRTPSITPTRTHTPTITNTPTPSPLLYCFDLGGTCMTDYECTGASGQFLGGGYSDCSQNEGCCSFSTPTNTLTRTPTSTPTLSPVPPTTTMTPTSTNAPPTITPTITATPIPTTPPEPYFDGELFYDFDRDGIMDTSCYGGNTMEWISNANFGCTGNLCADCSARTNLESVIGPLPESLEGFELDVTPIGGGAVVYGENPKFRLRPGGSGGYYYFVVEHNFNYILTTSDPLSYLRSCSITTNNPRNIYVGTNDVHYIDVGIYCVVIPTLTPTYTPTQTPSPTFTITPTYTSTPTPVPLPELEISGAFNQQTGAYIRPAPGRFSSRKLPVINPVSVQDFASTGSCADSSCSNIIGNGEGVGGLSQFYTGYRCTIQFPTGCALIVPQPFVHIEGESATSFYTYYGNGSGTFSIPDSSPPTSYTAPVVFTYQAPGGWLKVIGGDVIRAHKIGTMANHIPFITDKFNAVNGGNVYVTGDTKDLGHATLLDVFAPGDVGGVVAGDINTMPADTKSGHGGSVATYSLGSSPTENQQQLFSLVEEILASKPISNLGSFGNLRAPLQLTLEPDMIYTNNFEDGVIAIESIVVNSNAQSILIVTDANGNLSDVTFSNDIDPSELSSLVVIARNVYLATNVGFANAVFITSEKLFTGSGGKPLKIKGNVVALGGIEQQRSRFDGDHARPTFLIEHDTQAYLSALKMISINTLEYKVTK